MRRSTRVGSQSDRLALRSIIRYRTMTLARFVRMHSNPHVPTGDGAQHDGAICIQVSAPRRQLAIVPLLCDRTKPALTLSGMSAEMDTEEMSAVAGTRS